MEVVRISPAISADHSRVYYRPFQSSREEQMRNIISRIMSLTEDEICSELKKVCDKFKERHKNVCDYFLVRYEEIKERFGSTVEITKERKMLVGAYFTHEYSLEAAALFNPSIVWHPDQSDLFGRSKRFILSLRATGEGHISSIEFRSGIINDDYQISLDPVSRFTAAPERNLNPDFNSKEIENNLENMELFDGDIKDLFSGLGNTFSLNQLREKLFEFIKTDRENEIKENSAFRKILTYAESHYQLSFPDYQPLSERIIVPTKPAEQNGMEDARFVKFQEPDGICKYYATFTAYDGRAILPELLETDDFLSF